MVVADRPKARQRIFAWCSRHPGLAEFGIVGACLLIYFLIRGAVVERPAVAFSHAADVVRLEKSLGIFWEAAWQRAISADKLQISVWNAIYFWAHAPVIAAIAFWLYFRHRSSYRLTRNAFLISCLIGLACYAFYPVAPPRLLTQTAYSEYGISGPAPQFGFEDTMEKYSKLDYQAESLKPFVNPFAAVPSLHFGWAFLIGVGVVLAWRHWLAVAFAAGMVVLMFFGVVLTANHFIFDALTGFAVCLFSFGAAVLLARLRLPWLNWLTTSAGKLGANVLLQPEND